MDRMITAEINGKQRPLNYSISVMFEVLERYGNINAALEIISKDNADAFDAVRWFAVVMANDAELCRRDAGYDKEPMLTEKDITMRMRPIEYNLLRGAVVETITRGYQKEIEDEEIDLGLAELNAKKAPAGD